MVRYEPLRGSSYIKLPPVLANKKAILTLKMKMGFKITASSGPLLER